jgi:hypothetical protein
VVKRLEWLDSNFLAALNAFLSVPGVRGDPQLSELLSAIRQETLQLVRTQGEFRGQHEALVGCALAKVVPLPLQAATPRGGLSWPHATSLLTTAAVMSRTRSLSR